ncbi:MAG: hypothetical protein ABFD52_04985 [Acidobacteriota bacterium]
MKKRSIKLDRKRAIGFTKNSITLAENILKSDIKRIISHVAAPPYTLEKMTLFLWIALLEDDPKLTLLNTGRMVKELFESRDRGRLRQRLAMIRVPLLCLAAFLEFRREAV